MTLTIPPSNAADMQFEEVWRSCASAGSRIGRGTTRDVYGIPGHPDKVLKVCVVPSNQTNWIESVIFHAAGDYQQSFAAVHSISWSGRFLVMERLTVVTAAELSAARSSFPPFVNDRKPENYGKDANGKIKMWDYGMLDLDTAPPSTFV
jgi:hypothetical protein